MTFDDLRTYVRDRLSISSADTAKATQIETAINQARYRIAAEFALLSATDTLDFTADTSTVTLPSDLTRILSIYTDDWTLQPVTEQEYAEAVTQWDGSPQVYVVDGSGSTIRALPPPTDTVSDAATIRYVKRPTALSADDDTPDELPAEFHDLIGEEAIYRIAQSEEDQDLARGARAVADDLRTLLTMFMNQRAGTTAARQALRGFGR